MEKKLLRMLYDCFYIRPEFVEQEEEVRECHKALITALKNRSANWYCESLMPRIILKRRPLWIVL